MSKPLEFTLYLNNMNIGSMVLRAPGQYYKIGNLIDVVPLAAEVDQFNRSVVAGATPHSLFNLVDLHSMAYEFELRFSGLVYLALRLKTGNGGKVLVFDWQGKFGDFKDGFKIF